jgi:hypothetical protein
MFGGGTVRLGIGKKNATERKVISSHWKNGAGKGVIGPDA